MTIQELQIQAQKIDEARKRRSKLASFHFKPFSHKQKQVMTWWHDASAANYYDGIIADGAIRSGKSMSMFLSFGLWAMTCFNNENFLLCGKTIGSLRRNQIQSFVSMMQSQGCRIRNLKTENLLIITQGNVTNFFYLFGAKDEGSQDLVQGITAAGALFDEVALMPESFVNQATGRCSKDGRHLWFNCNPGNPLHWFNVGWIQRAAEKEFLYLRFGLNDNPDLSEKTKQRYRAMYQGQFYRRFIRGEWSISDGVIYDMFNPDIHTYDEADIPRSAARYIAIDPGVRNPCGFLDIYWDGEGAVYVEDEYYYDSQKTGRRKTDIEYLDDLHKFVGTKGRPYGVFIDPEAAGFKEVVHRHYVTPAVDKDVLDGINLVSNLFNLNLLMINRRCVMLIKELTSYIWDEKAAQRGEEQPAKINDHLVDCLRYFCKTLIIPVRLELMMEDSTKRRQKQKPIMITRSPYAPRMPRRY